MEVELGVHCELAPETETEFHVIVLRPALEQVATILFLIV